MNRGGLSSDAISAVLPSFSPQPLGITRRIDPLQSTPAKPTPTASTHPKQKKRLRVTKKKSSRK